MKDQINYEQDMTFKSVVELARQKTAERLDNTPHFFPEKLKYMANDIYIALDIVAEELDKSKKKQEKMQDGMTKLYHLSDILEEKLEIIMDTLKKDREQK